MRLGNSRRMTSSSVRSATGLVLAGFLGFFLGLSDMAKTHNIDLGGMIQHFHCEDKCHAYLEKLRWPEGVRCPRCEKATTISRIEARKQFECDACGYQF